MIYRVEKRQDKYYLMNLGDTSFNYEVQQSFNCTNYLTIYTGTVLADAEVEITFNGDGEYQVILTDATEDVITFPIHYYLELLESIIKSVEEVICCCGCGCDDCGDGADKCDKYCNLMLLRAKLDAYKRLISPEATAFYDAVYTQTKCFLVKPIYCAIAEEKITGEAKCNEEFLKQLIALDYLALYFYEIQVCLSADKTYIREKFNTDNIFCCIQDLGIDIGEIETLINESMGSFEITSAAYVNQPPSVGDYSLGVDNRASTVLTLVMFTSSTTPPYSDPEGDLPQAVRINTLPIDGTLYLDGIAVTPGQVIDVADINSNLLVYESPDQDALDVDTFSFDVQDSEGNWSS